MKVQQAVKEAIDVYVEAEKDTFNGREISALLGPNYSLQQVYNSLYELHRSRHLDLIVPCRGKRPAIYSLKSETPTKAAPPTNTSYEDLGKAITERLVALVKTNKELLEDNVRLLNENRDLKERNADLCERLNATKQSTQAIDLKSLGINL